MQARRATLLVCLLASGPICQAQTTGPHVSFNGSLGSDKALLVIDGELRTLTVGQSLRGVRLVSMGNGQAQIDVAGKRESLVYGASPASVGAAAASPTLAGEAP